MDYSPHRNIEEWFLQLPADRFKNKKDYPKIYSLAKDTLNESVHNEIKSIAASIVPNEYLNHHGTEHVETVISRASKLLEPIEFSLSPYEIFLLLMGIQLHDAGHIINGRDEHAQNIKGIINKLFKSPTDVAGIDTIEKKNIFFVAKAHSGKNDPIGKLEEKGQFCSDEFRLRLIAAIIRLADELADDSLRASTFLLELQHDKIQAYSKVCHLYSECLKSCNIYMSSHEVALNYVLNKDLVRDAIEMQGKSIFLVDEIFNRTFKTFQECLYCNRFLPETLRVSRISVNISFLDDETYEDFLDPIKYRLEESGYPKLSCSSVYEIETCKEALHKDGTEINGSYLKTRLENYEKEPV